MAVRRAQLSVAGIAVVVALISAACASGDGFGEVNAASGKYGASLETSTTISEAESFLESRGLSSAAAKRSGATESLLEAINENPELLAELDNLSIEELEELTGLSAEELESLGITPGTVTALGGVLKTIAGGEDEEIDGALANALLLQGSDLTEEGGALLSGLDPYTLAQLVGAAATVDEGVTGPLGDLLRVIDPDGLGQFAGDQSTLAVITVVMSAVLGRDPGQLDNLANSEDIDPRFRGVLGALSRLASTLEPEFVEQINAITSILGPNTLKAIGAAVGLLTRPAVAEIVEVAVSDPVVMGTMFGSFVMMVPGLAEIVAPESFGSDPRSIYTGMAAIMATALANMDAPGFRDFLELLGVEIHPDLLD